MLKRYQVLLNEWLADGIKFVSQKYDISFSEVIRVILCLEFIQGTSLAYPKYKTKDIDTRIKKIIKGRGKNEPLNSETMHKFFSDIYFETRKALEFMMAQQEKPKKK